MRSFWAVIGLFWLIPPALFAQSLESAFEQARIIPVKFETKFGKGYVDPDTLPLPNLNPAQFDAFILRLKALEKSHRHDSQLTGEHISRLDQYLSYIDRHFVYD